MLIVIDKYLHISNYSRYLKNMFTQWRRQVSEFGGAFEGQNLLV